MLAMIFGLMVAVDYQQTLIAQYEANGTCQIAYFDYGSMKV